MRVPFGGVRLAPLRRRIDVRRLALGDLPLKAAALAVALLLWVSALRLVPPPEVTIALDGRVPIERPDIPAGFVLRGQLGEVAVRVRGLEGAVRALGQQQVRASIDASSLAPGPEPQDVPVRVAVTDERVRVVEVTPASIAVRFERRTERTLAVQARLANDPPAGFQAGAATFRPQEVMVAGPESLVATVVAVLGAVRFGDAPLDLAQSVQPIPVDAAGQRVEGVEVDPVAVQVSVPVLSTATTRTVPILWQIRGAVAPGYWISRLTTDPVAVTVSGGRAAVAGVERVETAPVDVTGLAASRTFLAPLALPDGVALLGAVDVRVTVTVVALAGTRPFPIVAVQVTSLGISLVAEVEPRTVDVTLAGTLAAVQGLGADAVTATVDASGRGAGTHLLDVVVKAPAGTTVQSLQPARVTVTIRASRP